MLFPSLLLMLGCLRHPIHSSSARVSLPDGRGTPSIVLRVFAEDFPPGRTPENILPYLARRFHLSDAAGRAVGLRLDSLREDGAVLVIVLSAPGAGSLPGGRIWHGILGERFSDQVNLVQVQRGTHSSSLLFTSSDGPKALP